MFNINFISASCASLRSVFESEEGISYDSKKGTQASAFCVPSMDRLFFFLIYLFIGIFCRKLNLRLLYFIFSFYVSYTNGL